MESSVYALLQEMYTLVCQDERRVLTSHDIASLQATLHTLLAIYSPENQSPPDIPEQPSEARRAPRNKPKPTFWGIFG